MHSQCQLRYQNENKTDVYLRRSWYNSCNWSQCSDVTCQCQNQHPSCCMHWRDFSRFTQSSGAPTGLCKHHIVHNDAMISWNTPNVFVSCKRESLLQQSCTDYIVLCAMPNPCQQIFRRLYEKPPFAETPKPKLR